MSQLRLNPLSGRWVTIVAERAGRPSDFGVQPRSVEADLGRPCPFCAGHEDATGEPLATYGQDDTWSVRVVPNLYPAFTGGGSMTVTNLGPVFTEAPASGLHEVLVLSPDHGRSLADLDDESVALVMTGLRDRMAAHAEHPAVRYTQSIVNHGHESGASLDHPHGQLLGMPFVPGTILDEEAGFRRFEGSCLLCTVADAEVSEGTRVVYEDEHVVVVCPFWSGTPYEMLLIPRTHETHLQDAAPGDLQALGRALRNALAGVRAALGDVSYNVVFHSAPHHHDGPFHWHAHVWPKLVSVAGFERGTGVLINITPPEVAAEELRSAPGAAVSRVDVATTIDAPPDEVWAAVEDVGSHVDWMADATAIRFTSERRQGVGTAFDCDTRIGPIRLTDRMTITEWEPGRVMGVRHVGLVTGQGRFTLTPTAGGGTRFGWTEELRFPWWLGGPLGRAVAGATVLPWVWRRNLATLKALVEAAAPHPS